uniref:Mitochondrial assembly of ribosomal large subunit protein 1 n=3 Tax=Corvus TaxID=30420 RepID=A0A8C3H098_CORMO
MSSRCIMSAPFSKYWFLLLNILEQFHHNILSQIVEKHCSEIFSIFSVVLIMSVGVLRFNSSQLTSVMMLLTFKWQQQEKNTVPPKFNIDLVVALLRQENAKDICVIQLSPEIKYCDYFIIVSGFSTRHLHAMANYMLKMYKHLKEDGGPHAQIEGKETDDWLCIDFGDIVVHFMLPETREVYELEKLWTLGPYDDQLAQMTPQSLPKDFIFGLTSNSSDHLETRT